MPPTMITRTCLCGCAKTFRVTQDNKTNYFFMATHAKLVAHRRDEVGAKARELLERLGQRVEWGSYPDNKGE